jgi:hypothetical protein
MEKIILLLHLCLPNVDTTECFFIEEKYTYDHLARKLLNQHGWIRIPLYIPLQDTHPPEKNYGSDLISKINELEERIKSK